MRKTHLLIVALSGLLLTSCAIVTKVKVNKHLQDSTENISSGNYCDGLKSLDYALETAESGRRQNPVDTVLQNYITSYNTVMQRVAPINAQSSVDQQRLKADTWKCWLLAMRKVAPKMSPSLKRAILPAFTLDRLNLQEVSIPVSNAFYARAAKQNDKTLKFYDLLMSYYYNSNRPMINDEIQKAYNNAKWHIVIKNAGDKYIDSDPVLSHYIIPEIKKSIRSTSLDSLKSDILAAYADKALIYDIQNTSQKSGNNAVITLKSTKAKRTSNNFTRTVPVERTSTEQYCYDVDVYSRDDDKDKKIKLKRETERRCDDRTTTYTENTQESGIANFTELSGTMSATINGRSVLQNQRIDGSYHTENSNNDISWAAGAFADRVYKETVRVIEAAR